MIKTKNLPSLILTLLLGCSSQESINSTENKNSKNLEPPSSEEQLDRDQEVKYKIIVTAPTQYKVFGLDGASTRTPTGVITAPTPYKVEGLDGTRTRPPKTY